jgi:Icc-related predicted phosphoesterase
MDISVNIAIFSDLHGRILLAFMLCARWQQETGERITAILQAGDLGAYPDEARLDRATLRHARADPDELGFMRDFTELQDDVAYRLAETTCPMIFVRGNHEDHAWLDAVERGAGAAPLYPIDAYQRISCLRTGMPYTIVGDGSQLTVLGIGRIGFPPGASNPNEAKYAQAPELERLYNLGPAQVDILLTHDVPPTNVNRRSVGMTEIRRALDDYRPVYHFYGHTDEPYRCELDANGVTATIRMADLNWDRAARGGPLHAGVMGMLRWRGPSEHSFEVVDAPWLREYSANAWRWR